MEILIVLIPLSIILLTGAIIIFSWAVKNGQYDDLNTEANRILFDEQPRKKHKIIDASKDSQPTSGEKPE